MNSLRRHFQRYVSTSALPVVGGLPMLRQAGLLITIETLAHVIDYGFHLYLGRALAPSAFAAFQSYSALAMLFLTMAGTLQPSVARYTAAPPATPTGPATPSAILRTFLAQGTLVGLVAGCLLFAAAPVLAEATRLPARLLYLIALAMPLAMARPAIVGLLQGLGRFGRYSAITLLYAIARLGLVLAGLSPWAPSEDAFLAALTIPFALTIAVALGLLLVRREVAGPGRLSRRAAFRGWRLSLTALLLAGAYIALTSLDVVWINRSASADVAGAYARALVLRRVVSFLPVAAATVLFPRVASAAHVGRRPDRPLALALGLVLVSGAVLTGLYALWGEAIDRVAFGPGPAPSTSWLTSMALAMTGYGLVTLWINVFVATEPLPFGCLLAIAAPLQVGAYLWLGHTPEAVISILGVSGWLLAFAGATLYLLWLRPRAGQALQMRLE